jgi:hypothetical protein
LLLRELIMESCCAVPIDHSGDLRTDLISYLEAFRLRVHDPSIERAIATAIERATVNPVFSRVRALITEECTSSVRGALAYAVADGHLDSGTDVDRAVDELAGPVAFRRFFERQTVTTSFVVGVVDDFLAAHAPATPAQSAQSG